MAEAPSQEFLHVLITKNDFIGTAYINKIISHVSGLLDNAQGMHTEWSTWFISHSSLTGGCCDFSRSKDPLGKVCLCQHLCIAVRGLKRKRREKKVMSFLFTLPQIDHLC